MTSGKDLKLARVAADVMQQDLAARIGVTKGTVSRWEASRIVRDENARRYLAALATFATSETPREAA